MVTDRASIAIANKYKVTCGLSIKGFKFDLDQLGSGNGVSPNMLAYLLFSPVKLSFEISFANETKDKHT